MARPVQEINAGSMADIAFLLLIFFLVTTTMDVDAGISRTLPLKRDIPPDFEYPEVHARDVLEILANSNDQLMVEGRFIDVEELEEIVRDYYTANGNGQDNNPHMPMHNQVTPGICQAELNKLNEALVADPGNADLLREIENWDAKMELCKQMPGNSYFEMSKMSLIQLKNQANTTYGLYIEIQDILKKVVNELRQEICVELDWKNYLEMKDTDPDDMEKLKMLRVIVPERIVEARIDR